MAPTPHETTAAPSMVSPPPAQDKTIHIRTYTPTDLPSIIELFSAGMLLYTGKEGDSEGARKIWVDYIEESIRDDLANIEGVYFAAGGHFWVATCTTEDGKDVVVGTVALEVNTDKVCELRRMSVHAEYRRYGVGKKLVSNLEKWAKDQKLAKVWLSTWRSMELAHKFYRSIGYTQTKVEEYPEDPDFDVIYFEKLLG